MRWIVPVAVLLCGLVAVRSLRRNGGPRSDELLRPAPPLPSPDADARVRFYVEQMKSAERLRLGARQLPAWREFGETPLKALGAQALDFLLAEEREAEYESSRYTLSNVVRILPGIEGFREHPRLYPFLLHWLQRTGNDFRRSFFDAFVLAPDPAAVPACLEELQRKDRELDLRREACYVILKCGRAKILGDLFATLEAGELRLTLLTQIYRLIADGEVAKVRPLDPFLRRALESDRATERIHAAAALLRMGEARQADALVAEFHRADAAGQPGDAWAALQPLVADGADPRARRIALERVRRGPDAPGRVFALEILWRAWSADAEVAAEIWKYVRDAPRFDARPLLRLIQLDRPKVVAHLRRRLREPDLSTRQDVMTFAVRQNVKELGPDLLDLIDPDDPGRTTYYHALTRFGERRVLPLLIRELRSRDPVIRSAVASSLLELGDAAGLEAVAAALAEHDGAVLDSVLERARHLGAAGVDDALLAPLGRALTRMPGETDRLKVVLVFRYRGTIEGARDTLVDAYRRERSRRVAKQLRNALVDLVHR